MRGREFAKYTPMGFKTIITEWITKRTTRNQVIDGPFKGMAYPGKSVGSAYCPKLIGTYEKELFPVIAGWNDHQPEVILNVGGAEGYYAVGLARAYPQCKVIVWEAVHKGRQLISAMSRLNDVSAQIKIQGCCSRENLIEEVMEERGVKQVTNIMKMAKIKLRRKILKSN